MFWFCKILVLLVFVNYLECYEDYAILPIEKTKVRRFEHGWHKPPVPRPPRINVTDSTNNNASNRIYRGYNCDPVKHPSLAAILMEPAKNKLVVFCGGSLVSEKLILTAGHCAAEYIWGGVLMETEHEFIEQVDAYYVHPRFDSDSLQNDICIMVLVNPIKVKGVQYVNLPPKSIKKDMTEICKQEALIIGWGKTEKMAGASTLQCATVPIIHMDKCLELYGAVMQDSTRQTFCTLSLKGKDACTGDSGGPIFCGDLQIGVVSWGRDCGEPESPGIYTRTDFYYKFLRKVKKAETVHVHEHDEKQRRNRTMRSFARKSESLLFHVLYPLSVVIFILD